MPELPEVETVRRGLAPVMVGARIAAVECRRPDLRFPLPDGFAARLTGADVVRLDRRGKYLLVELSTDETVIMHLGMSGRFSIAAAASATRPGEFYHAKDVDPKHNHVVLRTEGPDGAAEIIYNDPRRFGFMDIAPSDGLDACKHFHAMGPEPLSNGFSAEDFSARLKGKKTPIKQALLDQRVVAGVGNIYACEALFMAGVSPRRTAASVAGARAVRLHRAVIEVLRAAIDAGGSSLKDFAAADGALGYFQHRFQVYDRADEECVKCGAPVRRIVQSGRSTFFCGVCQR